MDHGVHNCRRHGDDALEEERADDDVGDRRLIDGRAADKDGGNGGQCHVEGRGIYLDEAEALLINEDADRSEPSAHHDGEHTHLVHIHARGLCKRRVGADGRHGGARLGVEEGPHEEGKQRKEQQRTCRDGEVADIDLEEVCEDLIVEALEGYRRPQALAGKAPDHRRAFIRQQQPHHAHEGDGGEADIRGYHHLAALYLVEEPAVARAEDEGEGRGDNDGHDEAHRPREAELNGERRAKQAGDDAQRQAEVEAAAGVHHGDHRKHQHSVPAETVDGVGYLRGKIRADERGGNEQKQQERGNDKAREAEGADRSFYPVHKRGVFAG